MTEAEAILKADARYHRMTAFEYAQHGGDEKDWQFKKRSTCLNCDNIMVHSFVPDEPESILGFPLDNDCGILIPKEGYSI